MRSSRVMVLNSLRNHIKGMPGQTGKKDEANDGVDLALVIGLRP